MNTTGISTLFAAVAGGVLKAEAEGAVPSGSTVVFAGGTLALGEGVSAPTHYAADYDGPLPEIDLGDAELPKNYTIGWTGGKLRIWRHRGLKIVVR